MSYIKSSPERKLAFLWRVLSREIRLKILKIISQQEPAAFNEILTELNYGTEEEKMRVQSNQLAYHIEKLFSAGLIQKAPPDNNYSLTRFGRRILEWSNEVEPSFLSHLAKEEELPGAVAGAAGQVPVDKIAIGKFDLSKMYQFLIRIYPFRGVFCNGRKSLIKWKDGICDGDLHLSSDGTFDIELVLLCKNIFTEAEIKSNELFSKQDDVRKAAISFVEAILAYLRLATLSLWSVNPECEPPYSYPLV